MLGRWWCVCVCTLLRWSDFFLIRKKFSITTYKINKKKINEELGNVRPKDGTNKVVWVGVLPVIVDDQLFMLPVQGQVNNEIEGRRKQ